MCHAIIERFFAAVYMVIKIRGNHINKLINTHVGNNEQILIKSFAIVALKIIEILVIQKINYF